VASSSAWWTRPAITAAIGVAGGQVHHREDDEAGPRSVGDREKETTEGVGPHDGARTVTESGPRKPAWGCHEALHRDDSGTRAVVHAKIHGASRHKLVQPGEESSF